MQIGAMRPGTLSQQYSACQKPGCKCVDLIQPQKHGPFYKLSYSHQSKSTTQFVRPQFVPEVKLVASYWQLLILGLIQRGQPLVPSRVSDAVAICSLVMIVWARLSLGRNIGFVPAQREIVTSGAYRYMRHPIYTGIFLASIGVSLRAYSPRNLVLVSLGVSWFLVKSIVEENFLRADPQYAAYMQRVRARWIPFVA